MSLGLAVQWIIFKRVLQNELSFSSIVSVYDNAAACAFIVNINSLLPVWKSKKISNDQELIQSDPISCPQNQKGNN